MSQLQIPVQDIIVPEIKLRGVQERDPNYIDLLASIERHGVLEPIVVRPASIPGKYLLVDGVQRYSCVNRLRRAEVPARVLDNVRGEDHALLLSVVLNLHRVKTRPYEYALALRRYIRRNPELSLDELSREIGKDKAWLLDRLSLTNLTERIGALVDDGKLSVRAALGLAQLGPKDQEQLLPQAYAMTGADFFETCMEFKRNVPTKHVANRYDIPAFKPAGRSRGEMVAEYKTQREFFRIINENPDISKEDLWKLCLDWVLQMDPESLKKRREAHEAKLDRLNNRKRAIQTRDKENFNG